MPGGVHPTGQIAEVVSAGDAGQEGKHELSVPTAQVLIRRRPNEDLDARDAVVAGELEDAPTTSQSCDAMA